MGQPAFLQLPLHLVSQVLVQLDDLQTLAAALASHSLLYAAYKDVGATTVLLAILRNRIPENIMPYAIMAYKARTIDRQESRTLATRAHFRGPPHRILGRYVQHQLLRDDGDAPHAVPRFAAALIKTHSDVQYFCDRFIQEARPLAPQFIAAHPASSALGPPSSTEVYRVQRALYRFQVYCNLRVRQKGDLDDDIEDVRGRKHIWSQIEPFLSAFSPWVNEQLACIHDFLERGLSQSFDDVAAHDVEWGARSVNWLLPLQYNKNKQAYLTYGLHFLRELDQAKDFPRRQQLLKSKGLPATPKGLAHALLHLRPDLPASSEWDYPLGHQDRWTDKALEVWLAARPPDGVDGVSSDPFRIWWYAHKHNFPGQLEWHADNARLRRYGYVLWDWPPPGGNFSKRRVRELQDNVDADEDSMEELARKMKEMQSSWAERADVFKDGRRGYWSDVDLSQTSVVWPWERMRH